MTTHAGITMTLKIDGVEDDYFVSAPVSVSRYMGERVAELEEEPRVLLPEGLFGISDLNIAANDAERIEAALCDYALEA